MKPQFTGRALTLWPEWCPAFRGVRLRDGTPSTLDKGPENRPMAPWSTIAPGGPFNPTPGAWFAMHAGKYIGGRAGNDGALLNVVRTAEAAGWVASRRDGLVTRRPMAKHARSPSNYWTITDAGRATYAANPLPPIPRRK